MVGMKTQAQAGSIVRYLGTQHPELAGYEGVVERSTDDEVWIRLVQSRKGRPVPTDLVRAYKHGVRVLRAHSKHYL